LPLVAKYNKQLEDSFVVVTLEQRGAGKSYYPFSETEKISIDVFLNDLYIVVLYLLNRFNQDKLYLVGHSWGSVLGIKFIQLYPELIHAYVGCGQVVNMRKSSRAAYDFTLQKSEETHDNRTYHKLKSVDCTYSQKTWLQDLLFVTGKVIKYKGSLYEKTNYNRFILDFLLSHDYSLRDLVNRQKGSLQSIKYLWQELMDINFEDVTKFSVPIVFVEGRHDYHVSSVLAHTYFNAIESSKRFVWFESSCHFPQWSEPQKFHHVMKSVIDES
jgi:pimeloyl-ACP methyl ester carboxylesterase